MPTADKETMDRGGSLALVGALVGGCWVILVLGLLVGRLRGKPREQGDVGGWALLGDEPAAEQAEADEDEDRLLLLRGLRSSQQDVRLASVTALGRLGHRHEWAIDGLIEALAEGSDSPVRVAAALDELAPRPGLRLLPLLGHPSGAVRFSAVRLLSRYPALAVRHVPDATRDISPQIRAAALETLRGTTSGEALRCALQLLDDPHPLVRSHAVRTAGAVSGAGSALVVAALGDESWWVRDAARETLTAAGADVAESVGAALEDESLDVRRGAALVLQDLGLGEPVAPGGADVSGAQDRARRGIALGRPVIALESA